MITRSARRIGRRAWKCSRLAILVAATLVSAAYRGSGSNARQARTAASRDTAQDGHLSREYSRFVQHGWQGDIAILAPWTEYRLAMLTSREKAAPAYLHSGFRRARSALMDLTTGSSVEEAERAHARAALVLAAADLDIGLSALVSSTRAADLRRAVNEIQVASQWLHDRSSPELRSAISQALRAAKVCEGGEHDQAMIRFRFRAAVSALETRRIVLMEALDGASG